MIYLDCYIAVKGKASTMKYPEISVPYDPTKHVFRYVGVTRQFYFTVSTSTPDNSFVRPLNRCYSSNPGKDCILRYHSIPSGTTDTVQVLVRSVIAVRKVVVHHNVDPFDVDTTAEQVCGHQDTLLEVLELLVPSSPGAT